MSADHEFFACNHGAVANVKPPSPKEFCHFLRSGRGGDFLLTKTTVCAKNHRPSLRRTKVAQAESARITRAFV